jgi:hypothetical protein
MIKYKYVFMAGRGAGEWKKEMKKCIHNHG